MTDPTVPTAGTKQRAVVEVLHAADDPLTVPEIAAGVPDKVYGDDEHKLVTSLLAHLMLADQVERVEDGPLGPTVTRHYRVADALEEKLEQADEHQEDNVPLSDRRDAAASLATAKFGDNILLSREHGSWDHPFTVHENSIENGADGVPTGGEMRVTCNRPTGDVRLISIRDDGCAVIEHPDGETWGYPYVITGVQMDGRVEPHTLADIKDPDDEETPSEPDNSLLTDGGTRAVESHGACHRGREANPDTWLPDAIGDPPTLGTPHGLQVLYLTGRCACGHRRSGVAPDHKVPAKWGGGYMTSDCSRCLGTIEYGEEWTRIDRVVSDYSVLRPEDGDQS